MNFVDINGKRYITKGFTQGVAQLKDDVTLEKLADMLTRALIRIGELEKRVPPDGTEFEIKLVISAGQSATVSLEHGYDSAVRFWVTTGILNNSVSTQMPSFSVNETLTTSKILVLNAYLPNTAVGITGSFIIRVEPSQFPSTRLGN